MNRILDLSAAFGLYDRWAKRNLGQVHDTLIELADLHGAEEILDVGCGTGLLSSRLAEAADRIGVRGVDISPRMVKAALNREGTHIPHVEYQVGTVTRLPYSDGQFNVVFSCLLFHLLKGPDKTSALREISRTLKPGGRYVCAEFEKYPGRLFSRKMLEYPGDLIRAAGFRVRTQFRGSSITKRRPIIYRVLTKPA
ncbi:MAG: hypothetical protein A2Y76_00045 [Planctomycetes bacterium RBG_13_60_9]|nr:MAG: hypothetical protein A2Y76_00045 [Planctomycetes bacterium RBG_13_60_9]